MSADRWKVVKGLFQRAIKLPPEQWCDYLDGVCAGDESLRRDVASLLAEHEPGARSLLTRLSSEEITLRLVRMRSSDRPAEAADAAEEPTDG